MFDTYLDKKVKLLSTLIKLQGGYVSAHIFMFNDTHLTRLCKLIFFYSVKCFNFRDY